MFSADMDYRVENNASLASELFRRFSLSEIQSITNNFCDTMVIGRGGFGKVYKGFIGDGATLVAIKRLNPESKQGAKEFWTEVKTLYKLKHSHLITLIGYSDDNEEMILVYEFMSNGTLANHLYKNHKNGKSSDTYHMSWRQRLDICIGAARGLDYLHEGTAISIIHRDVKTTNILLDKSWVAKISDFGLSKIGDSQLQTHFSTNVKGTFGYLDPQYFLTQRLSKKSDVYAFGVVLFEVLCGRPAIDFRVEDDEQCSLAQWGQQCMQKGIIAQIVDPSLSGQISTNSLKVFAEVANKCLHSHPRGRPSMAEVARSLELVLESDNTIPSAKGIITKVSFPFARCLGQGIEVGNKRLKFLDYKNKLSRQPNRDPSTSKSMEVFRRFTLKDIRVATNNFDRDLVVGETAEYFTVYRGLIHSENLNISVKRWYEGISDNTLDLFNAEIRIQAQLQYNHLVSLIGYCIERNELITVYENIFYGCLYNHLYKSNDPFPWEKKLETCIGAARGVHYLHTGKKQPIMHRNLNTRNILLDQDWVAKITGLEIPLSTSFNPLVAGTVGYMDPEYIISGRFSVKSDVYSFGAILLELLCGREPMIYSQDPRQVNLVQWFNTNMEMGTLDEVIDPRIIDEIAPECLKEYVKLAEKCTRGVGLERPSMENVLDSLRYAQHLQETWQDSKQSSAIFSNSCSLSTENSFPKGILKINKAAQGCYNKTSFTNLENSDYMSGNFEDSDYISGNLAR